MKILPRIREKYGADLGIREFIQHPGGEYGDTI